MRALPARSVAKRDPLDTIAGMDEAQEALLAQAAAMLAAAEAVAVLTGAGVSAASGVPTFRGTGGLWRGHRPEQLATPEAFARDPRTVWQFYNWRRELLLGCKPNPAHIALAELERRCADFTLITQNVDGLHQAAGSRNVVEIHGNIWIARCTQCDRRFDTTGRMLDDEPRCDSCGGRLRPGVVWFGEALPERALAAAREALMRCDVMLVVGTSGVVQPAASFGAWAKENGAALLEVNLEPTPLSHAADVCLLGDASRLLPAILERVPQGR